MRWWRVTSFAWTNYPSQITRIDPAGCQSTRRRVGWIDGSKTPVPDSELIRFDSPTDALLVAGARAIRTCLELDAAASRHAEGLPPLDYFTAAEGADPGG